MKHRALTLVLALGLAPLAAALALLPPAPAEAAVSVLASLDELVNGSTFVVVATAGASPDDRYSAWEQLGGGRRIVTYTRLQVERAVVGAPGGEVWVRTLGGAVGKLGQSVAGEARIDQGSRSLLFLFRGPDGVLVVNGMSQGHFPIVDDGSGPKLASSPDAGGLVPRRGPTVSAREALLGTPLDAAIKVTLATLAARRGTDDKK